MHIFYPTYQGHLGPLLMHKPGTTEIGQKSFELALTDALAKRINTAHWVCEHFQHLRSSPPPHI